MLDETSRSEKSAYGVTVDGSTATVRKVSVKGRAVRLTLASAVGDAAEVRVSYTKPESNPVQDAAGNDVGNLSGQEVTVEEFTATFEEVSDHHDGSSSIQFYLVFGHPVSISYKTLRDHSFEVSGGEVSYVKRADGPVSKRWRVKVSPSSNTSVIITLPGDRPCNVTGAVCVKGVRLSNSPEATVDGPP